jgi:hypothetical protein
LSRLRLLPSPAHCGFPQSLVVIVAMMSVPGLSLAIPFDLNVDQCLAILAKTIELLLSSHSRPTLDTRDNLQLLIDEFFQEDAFGQSFCSMIVYGKHDGAEVTLDHFNKFVMRPRSSNKFELQPTSSTLPHPINSAARVELNHNTLLLGYEMINVLLNYVTLIHPRRIDLLFFGKKGIPLKWKNGILGKEDRKPLAPLSLPPLFIIQTRIQEAIAFSFLQKIANSSSFFFSQASGISWQPLAPPHRLQLTMRR